jgi:hypothetical protein
MEHPRHFLLGQTYEHAHELLHNFPNIHKAERDSGEERADVCGEFPVRRRRFVKASYNVS